MIRGPWYLSARAVRDYMRIAGLADTDDAFDDAALELGRLCQSARFRKTYGRFEEWRVKAILLGKTRRLNLSVSTERREEGHADQLVAVADHDRRP